MSSEEMNDNSIAWVVMKYLVHQGLTLRDFAAALSQDLGDGFKITHPTVINWRDGKTLPETDFLALVAIRYRDWRRDFALECLALKKPEVWSEPGGFWELARERRGE
jgi:hypothetical protein